MNIPIQVDLTIESSVVEFDMDVCSNNEAIALDNSTVINATLIKIPEYEGSYEITPTNTVQILRTDTKLMKQDLVINPIPSNWGLIGWNGSYLTVS